MVEGESDCHTLWLNGIPAIGIPGASSWKEEWAEHLAGIRVIYVVIEPDRGGESVLNWLGKSAIRSRVRIVRLECKDPSAMFIADHGGFADNFRAILEKSITWMDHDQSERQSARAEAFELCQSLTKHEAILNVFYSQLQENGLVGEKRAAKLLYLALTSRLLSRPVSIVVKGPSSAGKSFLTDRVLEFFPPSAYYRLAAMSPHALAYSEEPMSHRFLIIMEACGMESEMATYLIRTLLSEGSVAYETVEKSKDGLRPKRLYREGPTGLITTTTATNLHPENETRLLSITVTDTRAQTSAILEATALRAEGLAHIDFTDYALWHALQQWLEAGAKVVKVPFARALVSLIPPVATRLRRDSSTLMTLIQAHALLHQSSRNLDDSGAVLAELEDYRVVRELVSEVMSAGLDSTVSQEVRETVKAVRCVLSDGGIESVSMRLLANALSLDKSTVSRRVRVAVDAGYLVNQETKSRQPARIVMGEPLPEGFNVLPTPEEVSDCCAVACESEGIEGNLLDSSALDATTDTIARHEEDGFEEDIW